MAHEIEIKLNIAPKNIANLLHCDFFQQLADEPMTKQLKNTYFDTDNWLLQSQKIALRIRQDDAQYLQTFKTSGVSSDGLSKRLEWEWPLSTDQLDISLLPAKYWPNAISTAELKAQFQTNFARKLWYFRHEDSDSGEVSIIEIALDQGVIEARGCAQKLTISELELELKQGNTDVLLDLSDRLLKQCADLSPSDLSKAARGFQLLENNRKIQS